MKWILITLLLFGSVNALLAGGQWAPSVPDTSRLAAIEREISAIQGEVEQAENTLQLLANTLNKKKEEMVALETEIESIMAQYPTDSLPPSIYADYTVKVDRYNLLVEEYNPMFIKYQTLYKDYMVKISHYNSLVEEGMNLAQKHNRIWGFSPRGKVFLH